jgi:hypothetical protein
MASGSRPRRPVVGSRTSTSRPRKVAGRTPDASEPPEDLPDEFEVPEPPDAPPPPAPPEEPESAHARPPGRVLSLVLVVLVVLLAGVAAGEGWYLWGADDQNVPSASRPVVTSEVATASAVDTAAKALQDIVETSWKDYDKQVDEATTRMTPEFAKEYRGTAEPIAADVK